MRTLAQATLMTLVLLVLVGIGYPLAITGVAELLFPAQAHGSLVEQNGHVVGSQIIGQNFSDPRYFHPRPSAAGDKGYDASSSGGSNLAASNKQLIDTVKTRLTAVLADDPGATPGQVPPEAVTASASGLDPEISPAMAELQVARVAKARGLGEDQVRALVAANTRPRFLGVIGEPGVNVLDLNLALDDAQVKKAGDVVGSPYARR